MSNHSVGPGRRLAPAERRALIIAAACDHIAEHGLEHTSVRAIAAECGISVGAVMYHFPSIDALLVEALREASLRFTEQVQALFESDQTGTDRLLLVLDHALPDRPDAIALWRLWVDYWARAARDSDLAALEAERYAVMRRLIADILADGAAAGEFKHMNADDVALELVALVDGVGLQLMLADPEIGDARARRLLHGAVSRLRA